MSKADRISRKRASLEPSRWVSVVLTISLFLTTSMPVFAQDEAYHLQRGDMLTVVIPERDTNGERTLQIDLHGEISLGFYGRVEVAGLTLRDAERAVRRHMSSYLRSVSGIRVSLDQRQLLVTVTGLVEQPGVVTVPAECDLWTAINVAGGVVEGADLSRVSLTHEGRAPQTIDLRMVLTGQYDTPPSQLVSGDVIFVPASLEWSSTVGSTSPHLDDASWESYILVLGAVNTPGAYTRSRQQGLLSVLGMANGPRAEADLENARLITNSGSRRIDLTQQLLGEDPLRMPTSGPVILFVPERGTGTTPNAFSTGITVVGSVEAPGYFETTQSVPLMEILALAGGMTVDADLSQVRHVRRQERSTMTMEYDLEDYLEYGGLLAGVMVEPGDTLYLENRPEDSWETAVSVIADLAIIASAALVIITIQQDLNN